jgi:hypothetical protein
MAKQKGGRKLARSSRKKGSYQAQVFRTARNKAAAATRRARRKSDNPNPHKPHYRRKERRAMQLSNVVAQRKEQQRRDALRIKEALAAPPTEEKGQL